MDSNFILYQECNGLMLVLDRNVFDFVGFDFELLIYDIKF